MNVTLRKDDQFGSDGPQSGAVLYLVEIRKIEGEYWAYTLRLIGQDAWTQYIVPLDDLMGWNTENTESYRSTLA